MTIRQILIRRYWLVMLGLVVGIALGRVWHPTEQARNLRYGVLIVWGLSLFVFLYLGSDALAAIPCSRYAARLF